MSLEEYGEESNIQEVFGIDRARLYNRVYIIWNAEREPVYVGRATRQNVAQRVAGHISHCFSAQKPSKLSTYLFANHPDYFSWRIQTLSHPDIAAFTRNSVRCGQCSEKAIYLWLEDYCKKPLCNVRTPSGQCTCQIL